MARRLPSLLLNLIIIKELEREIDRIARASSFKSRTYPRASYSIALYTLSMNGVLAIIVMLYVILGCVDPVYSVLCSELHQQRENLEVFWLLYTI